MEKTVSRMHEVELCAGLERKRECAVSRDNATTLTCEKLGDYTLFFMLKHV